MVLCTMGKLAHRANGDDLPVPFTDVCDSNEVVTLLKK